VLTYHRVDEPSVNPWLDPGLISASPETFETQMKYLSANYQVVSVLDVLEAFENKGQKILPPRAVLVTFDDAYCDFEKHAWPVLKQYSIPVTLFVSTSFPDHPERLFWWDRLFHAIHTTLNGELNTPIGLLSISTMAQCDQAYTRLKNYMKTLPKGGAMAEVDRICSELGVSPHDNCVLGWDSLRKLASEGVILGAHTQTHPIMNHISFSDMQNEALGSLHDLQREIGVVPPIFAYPSGIYNQEVVKAVECAGFRLAFTTERGINGLSSADPMLLQRINIGARTTMPVLRAQLLSWSASLYPLSKKIFS
jgi:peptidoglycan/xylan/chitin deacetylase (PgdA/CDA1 family)